MLLWCFKPFVWCSVQLLSHVWLCDPVDCSMPGLSVHHQLLELTQTHVHWVSDAIQLSHLLSSPSPPAFNLSQHQGLFQWVSSLHQVANVLEFQLQHQSVLPVNIQDWFPFDRFDLLVVQVLSKIFLVISGGRAVFITDIMFRNSVLYCVFLLHHLNVL